MNLRDYGDGTNQDGKLWERDGLGEEWKSRVSSGHVKFELLSDIPVECQVGDWICQSGAQKRSWGWRHKCVTHPHKDVI